jgi:hypothetical protein
MSTELLGVIVLSLALAVVMFAYERVLREVYRLRQDKETLEMKARHRATRLVREAREKAVGILGEAKVDASKWQEVLDQELDKLIQSQLIEYKERLHTVSEGVEEDVRNETEDLKRAIEKETVETEKAAAARLAEEYSKVDKRVEEYKQMKFKEVEENIVTIMERVGREATGKALSYEGQTDLIIEALEQAKKQNVI